MYEDDDISTLQETRRGQIKAKHDKEQEIALIRDFVSTVIEELRSLSIVKIEQGVDVNNLDEIQAALHNELAKVTKQIASLSTDIKALNRSKIEVSNLKDIPATNEVSVKNLGEISIPDRVSVSNLSELKESLTALVYEIKKISIPTPIVNIPESTAPIVTVQPTPVNVIEHRVDIDPVVRAIDSGLNRIRTNSEKRPLAVRISDGQNWAKQIAEGIEKGTQQVFTSFPGVMAIRGQTGGMIDPATSSDVTSGKIVPFNYDSIDITPASQPTSIVYKQNGATVATLTLTWSDGAVSSVVRS